MIYFSYRYHTHDWTFKWPTKLEDHIRSVFYERHFSADTAAGLVYEEGSPNKLSLMKNGPTIGPSLNRDKNSKPFVQLIDNLFQLCRAHYSKFADEDTMREKYYPRQSNPVSPDPPDDLLPEDFASDEPPTEMTQPEVGVVEADEPAWPQAVFNLQDTNCLRDHDALLRLFIHAKRSTWELKAWNDKTRDQFGDFRPARGRTGGESSSERPSQSQPTSTRSRSRSISNPRKRPKLAT